MGPTTVYVRKCYLSGLDRINLYLFKKLLIEVLFISFFKERYKTKNHKSSRRRSAPDLGERYEGGISRIDLAPLKPSALSLATARAQATRTDEVYSGLESSLSENSIT